MYKRYQRGDLIGDYRVERVLGRGGMGEVYHAVHEKLGRAAAVKVLNDSAWSDPNFKTRFFNEARLQAALHHPNIAALYDFREESGQMLIFMEYVDGECLDDLVRERRLDINGSLAVFLSVCEAVEYVHRNGVIHRDIKSQNIKLASDGRAKLLDFGIAKDASSHGLTQAGGVIGTPHYLAPEQLDGRPASVQTDIWALGVLLYEMLTGDMPFSGESLASLVVRITVAEYAPPQSVNAAVPRDAAEIVSRCMAKDVARRYQAVDDIVRDVRASIERLDRHSEPQRPEMGTIRFSAPGSSRVAVASVERTGGDASTTLPSAESGSKKRLTMIVGAAAGLGFLAVVVVLAGAAIWWSKSNGNAAHAADPKTNGLANSQAAIRADMQRVRVDVDEGTAQVLRDGRPVGNTPYDVEAPRGESVKLVLRRDGFEDKAVDVEVGSGKKVLTFSLKSKSNK
ncbi:MAG: serine/threonine-protein kinase [Pyrinomonadaceae bacterium]